VSLHIVADSSLICLPAEIDADSSHLPSCQLSHLRSTYPNLNILIESEAAPELSSGLSGVAIIDRDSTVSPNTGVRIWARPDREELDLIITLGGDGTILHVSSLYARPGKVPPVLSFSMGSLGFLTPFREPLLPFSCLQATDLLLYAECMLCSASQTSIHTKRRSGACSTPSTRSSIG
jgi:NAD kinase